MDTLGSAPLVPESEGTSQQRDGRLGCVTAVKSMWMQTFHVSFAASDRTERPKTERETDGKSSSAGGGTGGFSGVGSKSHVVEHSIVICLEEAKKKSPSRVPRCHRTNHSNVQITEGPTSGVQTLCSSKEGKWSRLFRPDERSRVTLLQPRRSLHFPRHAPLKGVQSD